MKQIAILAILFAFSGCTGKANPTPSDLATDFKRYDDQQVATCGQIVTGGGKCTLKTSTKEIWLSSQSELCAAQTSTTSYANVSGLFSALDSGADLVLRKAKIEPISGNCP